jgi:hypothetical protein
MATLAQWRSQGALLEASKRVTSLKPEFGATDIVLYKTEPNVIDFLFAGFESRRMDRRERMERVLSVSSQLETEGEIFTPIARNPLKSPDSKK